MVYTALCHFITALRHCTSSAVSRTGSHSLLISFIFITARLTSPLHDSLPACHHELFGIFEFPGSLMQLLRQFHLPVDGKRRRIVDGILNENIIDCRILEVGAQLLFELLAARQHFLTEHLLNFLFLFSGKLRFRIGSKKLLDARRMRDGPASCLLIRNENATCIFLANGVAFFAGYKFRRRYPYRPAILSSLNTCCHNLPVLKRHVVLKDTYHISEHAHLKVICSNRILGPRPNRPNHAAGLLLPFWRGH